MSVKTLFSIKDLEHLSGVKAHTIRIWEKRYELFSPDRTSTNIRQYDLDNLKKLLNVTFLYDAGMKISKIAKLSDPEIAKQVLEMGEEEKEMLALNNFKQAMLDFDLELFQKTYQSASKNRSFRELFFTLFLPLLNDIGMLWQTGTIDPSHERFISELIKQKIIVQIESLQHGKATENSAVFALYLPYEEIHEIGLLYANYEILSAGFKSIYLGTNIPIDSLKFVTKHYDQLKFLSYFTVKPDQQDLLDYMNEFNEKLNGKKKFELWLMGYKTITLKGKKIPSNFTVVSDLNMLIERLETLKKS